MDAVAIIKSVKWARRISSQAIDGHGAFLLSCPLMTTDRELLLAGLRLEQEAACTDAHIVTLWIPQTFLAFFHLFNDKNICE